MGTGVVDSRVDSRHEAVSLQQAIDWDAIPGCPATVYNHYIVLDGDPGKGDFLRSSMGGMMMLRGICEVIHCFEVLPVGCRSFQGFFPSRERLSPPHVGMRCKPPNSLSAKLRIPKNISHQDVVAASARRGGKDESRER